VTASNDSSIKFIDYITGSMLNYESKDDLYSVAVAMK